MMRKLSTYLSFVRFSHSVFALPFALTGAVLAWRDHLFSWSQVAWIIVCMVSARSAAMGFNRLVDADHDALNPRTAMRELPRGLMTRVEAAIFVAVASIVFVRRILTRLIVLVFLPGVRGCVRRSVRRLRKRARRSAPRRKSSRAGATEFALASLAHEIRTPLNGILAMSELIAGGRSARA